MTSGRLNMDSLPITSTEDADHPPLEQLIATNKRTIAELITLPHSTAEVHLFLRT
jgi:hypothetical protein